MFPTLLFQSIIYFHRIKKGDFESLSVHPKDLGRVLGPMNLEDLPELTSEVPLWLATHTVIQEHTRAETGTVHVYFLWHICHILSLKISLANRNSLSK